MGGTARRILYLYVLSQRAAVQHVSDRTLTSRGAATRAALRAVLGFAGGRAAAAPGSGAHAPRPAVQGWTSERSAWPPPTTAPPRASSRAATAGTAPETITLRIPAASREVGRTGDRRVPAPHANARAGRPARRRCHRRRRCPRCCSRRRPWLSTPRPRRAKASPHHTASAHFRAAAPISRAAAGPVAPACLQQSPPSPCCSAHA